MTAPAPRTRAHPLLALTASWLAASGGVLGAAESAAPAAPDAPTAIAVLQGTDFSQEFRPRDASNRIFWNDQLVVSVDLQLQGGASILFCDQVKATARLDDGEVLEAPYRGLNAMNFMFSAQGFSQAKVLSAIEPTTLLFAPPAKPSRMIESLSGTARIAITDTSRSQHIVVKPKLNIPIAIYGLSPDGAPSANGPAQPDMILTMQDNDNFTVNYRSSGCYRLRKISLSDAAGKSVPFPNAFSMSMNMSYMSQTGKLDRPIAAIDLEVYDSVRSGRVAFGFDAVPLAGAMEASQRRRAATWSEIPLIGPFAEPVKAVDDPTAPVTGQPGNGGGQQIVVGNGGVVHVQIGGAVAPPPAPAAPAPAAQAAPAPAPAAQAAPASAPAPAPAPPGP